MSIERAKWFMKKKEFCSFGKKIDHRLVALGQSKKWLIEEVRTRTGLYFDRSYLRKIEIGELSTPKIVQAICDVLGLPFQDDFTKRRDR